MLELGPERTVVIEAGTAAVDFEGGGVEELALEEVFTLTTFVVLDEVECLYGVRSQESILLTFGAFGFLSLLSTILVENYLIGLLLKLLF